MSFRSGPSGALDPYEQKWLEQKAANNGNMGQGVFTKRDLEPSTLVLMKTTVNMSHIVADKL